MFHIVTFIQYGLWETMPKTLMLFSSQKTMLGKAGIAPQKVPCMHSSAAHVVTGTSMEPGPVTAAEGPAGVRTRA